MATRADTTLQPAQILINGAALDQAAPSSRSGRGTDNLETRAGKSLAMSPNRSRSMSPFEASAVEQVMNINRRLVTQIETLRLKVEIDARHQQATKSNVMSDADTKIKARDSQLRNLQDQLHGKDEVLKSLEDRNYQKESAIHCLDENIKELKDDIAISKEYANEIESQLEQLKSARKSLESGSAYQEKDTQIQELQAEVEKLHKNLASLEKELSKAKDKIADQGTKLRLVNWDRLNTQAKYKEELAKVTKTMRGDVERMREIMRQQWEEMRDLREQNESMRTDLREIRNLILASQQQSQAVGQRHEEQHFESSPSGIKNQTRIYGHANSPYDLQPLSPTLPFLSPKEKQRRAIPNSKRKT